MTCRRVLTSVLIASCWLLPNASPAQGQSGSYRMGSPYGQPPDAGYPPFFSGSAYPEGDLAPLRGPGMGPPQGMSGYGPPPGYPGYGGPGGRYGSPPPKNGRFLGMGRVGQRLFGPPGEQERGPIFPDTPAVPYQTATPSTAVPGVGYYGQDGIVTRKIPDEESWDEDGPVERFISTAFKNSFFRTEYLFWDITDPSGLRLGAQLAGNVDPDNIALLDGNNQVVALGRIPTTDRLALNDNSGVRLTWGIPTLMGGDFEVSGFILEQASDRDSATDIPDFFSLIPRVVVTSTTTNGQAGSNVFVYDTSYSVDYKTDMWGLDTKYIFDVMAPEEGLRLRPFVGVRYMSLNEMMTQRGVFTNFGQNVPLTSLIESSSYNNLFGGQIGARLEFVHPWFTLGAEPKAGLGLNKSTARVQTTNLRSLADGEFTTEQDDTRFTPVFEGRLYAQIHLTDYFSLHAGYNWMYIPNLIRANNIIDYNDNGINNPPGVVVDSKTSDLTIRGLSVGGEIRFR